MSGKISVSMGVNTKPAKKIEIASNWVLVDPNMSKNDFNLLVRIIRQNFEKVKIIKNKN